MHVVMYEYEDRRIELEREREREGGLHVKRCRVGINWTTTSDLPNKERGLMPKRMDSCVILTAQLLEVNATAEPAARCGPFLTLFTVHVSVAPSSSAAH